MKELDWGKINNDRDFQRLVNDLFALEINNPGYLSSSPAIAADGGWDGRYDGPYMEYCGVWNFQSKWTKHNLNQAYKQLRQEVKDELKKAKKNRVDYLLIATNADLRVGINDHVGKLERLNQGQGFVKKLFIWPRANLESRIVQYPWLRYNYFGDTQEPMFVPPQKFAKAQSEHILSNFLGREDSLETFEKFLQDSRSKIFIVHACGGYGKTHFIIDAGKNVIKIKPDMQAWFCRPGISDLNNAINELNHEKNTVVFLDDADRYQDEARKLIAHTKTFCPGLLKIILSCRSSGLKIVEELACKQSIYNYEVFELPKLPEKILIEILNIASGSKTINHPERIVKQLNGNLFLIVVTGKYIKDGATDGREIKTRIKDELDREAENALQGLLNERDTKNLLRELSAILPFPKEKQANKIIEQLASVLDLKTDLINEAMDRLVESKILRKTGSSLRFNPDMKGDIYLSIELDKKSEKNIAHTMLDNWLSICPDQLMANLADASLYKETTLVNEAVKDLLKKWIDEVSQTNDWEKAKRLELAGHVAFLAPDQTINLTYAYIDSSSTEEGYRLNQDSYGPIIYSILHIPGYEKVTLELILYIAQKGLKGTCHNYKPTTLIRNIVSPIEKNITSATNSLNELLSWVNKASCTELEAELASEGVKEALSGSHEYQEGYEYQLIIGRKVLRYSGSFKKSIDQYRDKAMEVLKCFLFHQNDKIKKMGIEIIDYIGYRPASKNDDFWDRILRDIEKAFTWLEKLINFTDSHQLLSAVEDVLIRYWEDNEDHPNLSAKAADILRAFPRSIDYLIFRYFVVDDLIISDFKKLEEETPGKDRRTWLIDNYYRCIAFQQRDFDVLVKKLSDKNKQQDEIIGYLNRLENEINGIARLGPVPLIETWSKFNEKAFIQIATNRKLMEKIPERFHPGICQAASDKDKRYIDKYAESILADLENLRPQMVGILLDLIISHNVSESKFMPWLLRIIERADDYVRSRILYSSYQIFKDRPQKERDQIVYILEQSLQGEVGHPVLEACDFLIQEAKNWNLRDEDLEKIRKRLVEIIREIPKIDHHTDNLLGFAINSDLDKFISLVDYRIKKQSEYYKRGKILDYDAMPFDGFGSVKGLIRTYEDFVKLMEKVNTWSNEGLLSPLSNELLISNLCTTDNEQRDYLMGYISEKVEAGDVGNLRIAANALCSVPFSNGTTDLYLEYLIATEKVGLFDEIKHVLAQQVFFGSPSATWQISSDLAHKKESLERMYDKCPPGTIKSYINSLITSVIEKIQKCSNIDDDDPT
ncbi:MAG: hypothetical protein PHU81_02260 [Acidobacteriota bacterium]|nr:hypothetical protein [Acidobacteriota bacterium]